MTVVDLLRDLGEFFPLVFDHNKARHKRKHFPDSPPPHPATPTTLFTRFPHAPSPPASDLWAGAPNGNV